MRRILLTSGRPGEHDVLRRNFIANVLDGGFFALAMALVSQQTVLPVFVKRMGGSNFQIGLIPVLWTFGFNFPGIFLVNMIRHYPRKKGIFLKTAMFQRLTWVLLGIFSFLLLDRLGTEANVLVFFILFVLAAVSGSLNLPIWFDLIAKLTPVELRGRLFAARNILGGILGVAGGVIVEQTLESVAYPLSFTLLFLYAVVSMMISYAFLNRLREESDDLPRTRIEMKAYLFSLPAILRSHREFRNFLISDALLLAATMASAFYAVNGLEKFSLSDSWAGTFTVVMTATTIAGSLFFGYVGDQHGHKLNLVLSAVSTALAAVAALAAPSPGFYLLVFVGAALTVGLSGISRLSIVAELCPEKERLTYVALTNMITAPFVLLGLCSGWVANRYGYDAVFIAATILAAASAFWLGVKVKDPRRRQIPSLAGEVLR